MVECVKNHREMQVDGVHSSSLDHWCSHPITQGHKGGQVGLALSGEPCCLSQITSLFSIFPNMASSRIHFKSSQAQR